MTDGILAIAWPTWFRLAAASWLLLFAAVWFDWLYAWPATESPAVLKATGVVFACTLLVNALPGTAALLNRNVKEWPPQPPEAAALSSLTVAALLGIAYGATSGLALGMELRSLASVVIIGIAAFPLTLGLAFPMGVPLGCAYMVWSLASRDEGISLRAWTWLTGISAVGWALVTCLGIVLGHR
ncbi:MAG: hypothetical protein OXP66_14995 [Candidatus Tectomicrobia bacterium]|nr:hypothetical protein [Candidatus Tectomicrobia bacterium]